jgi:hypothetical protein
MRLERIQLHTDLAIADKIPCLYSEHLALHPSQLGSRTSIGPPPRWGTSCFGQRSWRPAKVSPLLSGPCGAGTVRDCRLESKAGTARLARETLAVRPERACSRALLRRSLVRKSSNAGSVAPAAPHPRVSAGDAACPFVGGPGGE